MFATSPLFALSPGRFICGETELGRRVAAAVAPIVPGVMLLILG